VGGKVMFWQSSRADPTFLGLACALKRVFPSDERVFSPKHRQRYIDNNSYFGPRAYFQRFSLTLCPKNSNCKRAPSQQEHTLPSASPISMYIECFEEHLSKLQLRLKKLWQAEER
jgi:hypothetical protein